MTESIELMGFRKDAQEEMQKSHCFVLPSLREGMPLVLLESGYMKIPIIASSKAINNSIITDEEGYIVDLNDITTTMEQVYCNYDEAINKADRFYEKVKNKFSIRRCVEQHEFLYSNIFNE